MNGRKSWFAGAVFAVSISVSNAGELFLQTGDFERLVGQWEGNFLLGKVRQREGSKKTEPMEVEIQSDNTAHFHRPKNGKKWDSDPRIVDGELEMRMSGGVRKFVVFEENGQLTMITHFKVERSGESRDVEVTFTRTGP